MGQWRGSRGTGGGRARAGKQPARGAFDKMLRVTPEQREKNFATISTDPALWHWHARQLLRAAELLWAAHEPEQAEANRRVGVGEPLIGAGPTLWMPYSVLAGLAVECAIKTCWAAAGKIIVRNGRLPPFKRNGVRNGHDISGLADQVGLVFEGVDHQLCDALSDCVEWGGKYPAALRSDAAGIPLAVVTPEGPRHLIRHDSVRRVFQLACERATTILVERGG